MAGVKAVTILVGLLLVAGVSLVAQRVELLSGLLALLIIFQPEIRRALIRLGHSRLFQGFFQAGLGERNQAIEDVIKAAESLAAKRIGALMVIERTTSLSHYAELGVPLDGLISADLLGSLFLPYSPLHDGAVIIQGDRVQAAGCFLPLSRNVEPGRKLGTRHRAALGISEETDAVALVVSEETGRTSLAVAGHLENPGDRDALLRRLAQLVAGGESAPGPSFFEGVIRRWWVKEKA